MKIKDLKYLAAFIVPTFCAMGILYGGWISYGAVLFAFGFIPILEPFLQSSEENVDTTERSRLLEVKLFDFLLFLNIPFIFTLIFLFGTNMVQWSSFEIMGNTLSLGVTMGACGINVAHELGHRSSSWYQNAAKLLLLPSLYMHFFIEHNRGHHKHVATLEDPATARYNEMLYTFWVRSIFQCYIKAWSIEFQRLKQESLWSKLLKNEIFWYTLVTAGYVALCLMTFGLTTALQIFIAGWISILLLETINYIEHYGLLRNKLENGRYERVLPRHSWNSNHQLGRIVLYELTRHSDHHYLANKEYQILDHHEESLQLPVGYPASMLMAMVPPLWFKVMNPRLKIS